LLATLAPLSAFAGEGGDSPAIPFVKSADIDIVIVTSLEKKDQSPVVISVEQIGFHHDKGYDLRKTIRPDLMPGAPPDGGDRNLLFKNGEVREENVKDGTWVKYRCDKPAFLDWLSYNYFAAGFWQDIGQQAVQKPDAFIVTHGPSANTYVTKPKLGDVWKLVRSITLSNTPPILLQEVKANTRETNDRPPRPDDPVLSFKFSYGKQGSRDADSLKPPPAIKQIENPLPAREVYP
jgi:hypothetical protein